MAIEDHFPNVFTVKKFGGTNEYGDADARLDGDTGSCRLAPAEGEVVQDDRGKDVLIDALVYLLSTVTIEERDHVDIDGVIYRVIKLRRQTASQDAHHIRLSVRRVGN